MYKVVVSVPREHTQRLMDAVDAAIGSPSGKYRRVFSVVESTGTWIPQEGSSPFIGSEGEISVEPEDMVHFAVDDEHLAAALEAVAETHPYEEPAVDVYRIEDWRALIR